MRFTHTKIENMFYALYSVRFFVKKSFLEKKNTVKCVLFGVRICLEKFIISLACVVSCDQLSVRFFLIFPVRLVFDFLENIELS